MDTKGKNETELYEGNSSDGVEVASVGFDTKSTKRLLRKIDMRLIPFLALLYLLSFLDRTNIGNARLAGLEADLGMKGLQYNVRPRVVRKGLGNGLTSYPECFGDLLSLLCRFFHSDSR